MEIVVAGGPGGARPARSADSVDHHPAQAARRQHRGDEQGRRQWRRGLPGDEAGQGRGGQARHRHQQRLSAATDRQAWLPARRPHPGGGHRGRRFHSLELRRRALERRPWLHRSHQAGSRRQAHGGQPVQGRRSDADPAAQSHRRYQAHLHPLQERQRGGDPAGRQAHHLQRQQPQREPEPVAWWAGGAAVRIQPDAHGLYRQGHRDPGLVRRAHLQGAGPGHRSIPLPAYRAAARQRQRRTARLLCGALRKVSQTPEFKAYIERNALVPTFLEGQALQDYIAQDSARVTPVFEAAGWLKR